MTKMKRDAAARLPKREEFPTYPNSGTDVVDVALKAISATGIGRSAAELAVLEKELREHLAQMPQLTSFEEIWDDSVCAYLDSGNPLYLVEGIALSAEAGYPLPQPIVAWLGRAMRAWLSSEGELGKCLGLPTRPSHDDTQLLYGLLLRDVAVLRELGYSREAAVYAVLNPVSRADTRNYPSESTLLKHPDMTSGRYQQYARCAAASPTTRAAFLAKFPR